MILAVVQFPILVIDIEEVSASKYTIINEYLVFARVEFHIIKLI